MSFKVNFSPVAITVRCLCAPHFSDSLLGLHIILRHTCELTANHPVAIDFTSSRLYSDLVAIFVVKIHKESFFFLSVFFVSGHFSEICGFISII